MTADQNKKTINSLYLTSGFIFPYFTIFLTLFTSGKVKHELRVTS